MTDILTTLPDAKTILVIAPNSDGAARRRSGPPMWPAARTRCGSCPTARDPTVRDTIRNEPQWVGSVAYFPESYGELILPLAIALAKGETVPEQSLVTHMFINKDNIDQYYPE